MSKEISAYRLVKIYFDHKDGKLRDLEVHIPDNYGEYLYTSILVRKEIEDEKRV